MSGLTRPAEPDGPLPGHPWRRLVALGDGTTEGYGMDPVDGVEQVPWATRVAYALADARPELEFHNLGRRGLRAGEIREQQLGRRSISGPTWCRSPPARTMLARATFSGARPTPRPHMFGST